MLVEGNISFSQPFAGEHTKYLNYCRLVQNYNFVVHVLTKMYVILVQQYENQGANKFPLCGSSENCNIARKKCTTGVCRPAGALKLAAIRVTAAPKTNGPSLSNSGHDTILNLKHFRAVIS